MIYKATKLISQEMDRRGFKYHVEEINNKSVVVSGFRIGNGPIITVQFVSCDNDNDVSVRIFGFVNNVADDKVDEMLRAINECHSRYRFVRFLLDEDRDVNIEYDLPAETTDVSVGAAAVEIFIRIYQQIADEAYRTLMSVILS